MVWYSVLGTKDNLWTHYRAPTNNLKMNSGILRQSGLPKFTAMETMVRGKVRVEELNWNQTLFLPKRAEKLLRFATKQIPDYVKILGKYSFKI